MEKWRLNPNGLLSTMKFDGVLLSDYNNDDIVITHPIARFYVENGGVVGGERGIKRNKTHGI